jgi:hypothetical protein
MSEIRQAYVTDDGTIFPTKAEAVAYERKPKILAALMVATANNNDLSVWLMDNDEQVLAAFDAGTIRRVTKSDRKKLKIAIDHLIAQQTEATVAEPKLSFLVEHGLDIIDTFRFPTVKRMSEEEKANAAHNTLMLASDNNEGLVDWVVANEAAILAAFDAGKVKREVSPKATAALAEYRNKKAAEKAEKEAKEAAEAPVEAASE